MEHVCREILQHRNCASNVWADTSYRSKRNEALLEKRGLCSQIHFRRIAFKDLNSQQQRANAVRSKVRCKVEHVFAHQKHIMGLFIQTIGIERTKVKIAMAKIAYNMRRMIWIGKQAIMI